jgi:hypothetical protein
MRLLLTRPGGSTCIVSSGEDYTSTIVAVPMGTES